MSLIEMIRNAGVVGCGGAGFPTDVKLDTKAEYLLINGMECEPMLRTDRYLMINRADEIVSAAAIMGEHLGASEIIIGIKDHYREEREALERAVKGSSCSVRVQGVSNSYPAGDEHVVVYELTGRRVPPGGIPVDVGCVVDNVGTVLAVYEAIKGLPVTDKYLTVAGEVENPVIVKAPIGTPVSECLKLAGGTKEEDTFLISGGPMMGKPLKSSRGEEDYVTKTTSGILAFKKDSYMALEAQPAELRRKEASKYCIQCSYCTMLCPRNLLGHPLEPHKIMRLFALGEEANVLTHADTVMSAALCSQCGVCGEYACPMGLKPNLVNQYIKEQLAIKGIKNNKWKSFEASGEREWRKLPSRRLAARMGLLDYYDIRITDVAEACPSKVFISLRQGIGAGSKPVVGAGDKVKKGDLIAVKPENALGSNIHASIDGTVLDVNEAVVIGG